MKLRRLANIVVKLALGTVLGVAVAGLTAFNVLLAWVATGPRSLDVLSPYIEAMFEPQDHKYSVSVGQTWLVWDGWKHPIDIRLRNVKVITNERHTYSKFPEISLGLDLFGLARGQMLPTSLTLSHPVISLYQNEDRSISYGLEAEASPDAGVSSAAPGESVPFEALMAPFLTPDDNSPLRALRLVSVVDATLTISSKSKGVFFKTSDADFSIKRGRLGLQLSANALIAYDNYQSTILARFFRKHNSTIIDGDVTVSKLIPGTLADLFAHNSLVGGMKFPISGKARLSADTSGKLQSLHFSLDGGEGTIENERLDGTLDLKSLHAEGTLLHDGQASASSVEIAAFAADVNGSQIEGKGSITLGAHDPEVNATLGIKNLEAKQLHVFWPASLAPLSRDWVVSNITEGKVPKATATINIAAGDLSKATLPKQDVEATIQLENATIAYLPQHPPVTAVNGSVHIDGLSLEATIDSATYMKDSRLSAGKVVIADLNPDNPYIEVSLSADTNARDVIKLLELPPLKHAQRLNLNAESAEGRLKGTAWLGFHFFSEHKNKASKDEGPDVDFKVAAELSAVSQAGFMRKFDGKNITGNLNIDNKLLEFKGGGDVNGASVAAATVKYLFEPEDGFDTFITTDAVAPVTSLPRFGYPAFDFLKGSLGVKANLKMGDRKQVADATLNLTDAELVLATLHHRKPARQPASLELTSEKTEEASLIPSFHYKTKNTDAQGSAEISKDMTGIRKVSVEKLQDGATKLEHLTYEKTEGGYAFDLRGAAVDLSPWFASDPNDPMHFSFEQFPALQLQADIGRVILGEGRLLLALKGNASCSAQRCESAHIEGKTTDSKPFNFRILRNPKGRRQVSLHAESAGEFVKALNIFDGMDGGDLTLTGNYTETKADKKSVLRGRLDINEHTVKNASLLAKIFSLASLTGFFDTLQGKGIHFVRLTAPFTLTGDVLTLNKAKTFGNAMGLTADGSVNFPSVRLEIEGTVVPSYSLNNVLGKVPLLGKVITGGEGEGVLAVRYSIGGIADDPKVSVNPLSILTPGFLRGLFDIFDKPKPQDDEEDEE